MAAELCRVSLWLEALEPGKPLSFLDHHIRVGNSLLGATPELVEAGLPDEAFKPIQGDDTKVCSGLKRKNRVEREDVQQVMDLMVAEPRPEYGSIASLSRDIDESPDDTLDDVRRKEARFRRLIVSPRYRQKQRAADAWCAAFVWPKRAGGDPALCITTRTVRRLQADLDSGADALSPAQHREVERLARRYRFFHWDLAFPEVFENGGFDCVLGNPPWERVKLQEKEWFSEHKPEVADAPTAAARKRMIQALKTDDFRLYRCFLDDLRESEGWSHLMRNTGRYPLCGRGDINLYAVFAEAMRNVVNEWGRCSEALDGLWDRDWLLGFTSVTSPTNERTMNSVVFPRAGAGNSMPVLLGTEHALDFRVLYANLCSFVFDYAVRQNIGGVNLNFYLVNQFPALPPEMAGKTCPWDASRTIDSWVTDRALELTYTAWDLEPFANDCGYHGPPFRWNEDRRFLLRCELDAAFFHLYLPADEHGDWRPAHHSDGCPQDETPEQLAEFERHFPRPRDAVAYVLDAFPIVRRKDEERFGEYRTKHVVLDVYDSIQVSIATGAAYRTVLDPPPADPGCCHPP